jgi:hypothetical protein
MLSDIHVAGFANRKRYAGDINYGQSQETEQKTNDRQKQVCRTKAAGTRL